MSDIIVEVDSVFKWNLIFDYDNSDNAGASSMSFSASATLVCRLIASPCAGQITQSVSIEITGSYMSKTFMESIQTTTKNLKEEHVVDAEVGASYGPVSATMKYGYHNTKELTDMLQNTTSTQTEETKTWAFKETRECKPLSSLLSPLSRDGCCKLKILAPDCQISLVLIAGFAFISVLSSVLE